MTLPEYVAEQTERMAESLAHFIATTAEDRLDWKPEIEGSAGTRSAYEQASECIHVNRLIAALVRGEDPKLPSGVWQTLAFASSDDAQKQITESGRELAEAIRTMSDDDLAREYNHPRGRFAGRNLIMMPLRNMAYHSGQINLYQILYGDADFHVPPRWR